MTKTCRAGLHQYESGQGCPECRALYIRGWHSEHAEERRGYKKVWRLAHPDSSREGKRAFKLRHPERLAEMNRRSANKKYAENPDKFRAIQRRFRDAHPEIHREQEARRRARMNGNGIEPVKLDDWRAVVEFYGGLCAYCGDKPWAHIDHVLPLALGGRHAIANLVPACVACNCRKSTKLWEPLKKHQFMRVAA